MNARFFVDTNIFIYNRDNSEPEKQKMAKEWLSFLWRERAGHISTQVLNEYYVTVTQKLDPGLPEIDAWSDVQALFTWRPFPVNKNLLIKAKTIKTEYQLSWWDSLIIGAAILNSCDFTLSEDLQDKQIIAGTQVINPFSHTVSEIIS